MSELLLKAENITKTFPGVKALDKVNFDLRAGEVHVLFGENGAGKSTLTKVLAGSYLPDEGEIYLNGEKMAFKNPYDARNRGVSAVYQEFSLVPKLTVVENLFLGREMTKRGLLDKEGMLRQARESLADLGFDLDPMARVGLLKRAERQMVEITKAFQGKMSVLILDEPTASLSDKEVIRLFELIERLKGEGVGIIYISHRIDELKKVGDRISVLRDGRNVATLDMAEADEETLISLMTGRDYEEIFPEISTKFGKVVLEVQNLTTTTGLHDINFQVHEGEILGIAGLVGAGKSRVGRALYGLEKITGGTVILEGYAVEEPTPKTSLKNGVMYFPADRHKEGLVLCRSVRENQTLASLPLFEKKGLIDMKREEGTVRGIVKKMNVRPNRIHKPINNLSGGNQQKVMLSRGLTREVKLFIFDEASCGIDVGAKREVYLFLKEQAERGAAVIFISSELPEVLNLSHNILVMHAGTVAKAMPGKGASEEDVLSACFGYEYQNICNNGNGSRVEGAVANSIEG
ncbi:MAG: sugar ABC transporter ATP-binding protein [Deltaproteobacteria bacterium]|nr:sugar ABC transporter ATP-binding protein [Deltaproteobacteria bacterium]